MAPLMPVGAQLLTRARHADCLCYYANGYTCTIVIEPVTARSAFKAHAYDRRGARARVPVSVTDDTLRVLLSGLICKTAADDSRLCA